MEHFTLFIRRRDDINNRLLVVCLPHGNAIGDIDARETLFDVCLSGIFRYEILESRLHNFMSQ